MNTSHKCGFIAVFFCLFISATAIADRPSMELKIDEQHYDFRIESRSKFTIQNSDVTVTISLDRKKNRIEISTETPTGISIEQRKFSEIDFGDKKARNELRKLLKNKNVRVNGKDLESDSYFSFEESDAFPNSPAQGLASQKIDLLSLIGIDSAYANTCSDVCSGEMTQLGFASAGVIITCSSAVLGGPIAWASCAVGLGVEVWAADQLADCLESHPAQCRIFEEQK